MIFACEFHDAGEQLAISSHGSALQLVSISKQIHNASSQLGLQSQQLLSLGQLPLRCIGHLSETKLVGAGFEGEVCSHPDTRQSVLYILGTQKDDDRKQDGPSDLIPSHEDRLCASIGHSMHRPTTLLLPWPHNTL